MQIERETARPGQAGTHALILLPGVYQLPGHMRAAGFHHLLHARYPDTDLLLPVLDLAEISAGDILPRLHAELLNPTRAAGYASVSVAGISLGGLLALNLAATADGHVDRLCLLSPYPGSRITTKPITTGGLAHWRAPADTADEPENRAWRWIRDYAQHRLPIFLGYGQQDRFADGIALMQQGLPASAIHAIPGTHDWPTWRQLWQDFLLDTTWWSAA